MADEEARLEDDPNFGQNLSSVAGNMTVMKGSNIVFCPYADPDGYRGAFPRDTETCVAAA